MSEVLQEILAIKRGKMVWQGHSAELLEKDLLSEIFETRFESFSSDGQLVPYVAPRGLVR